ncbi:hypothetical protein KL86DYS1_10408 [uncultured Dysgonomonas sp.]|uniref:Uncharacterized protein n=1 Tax=uncultured Dysgonomonas sp. TaxID=206096 RepID=A0A212IX02_9BACT|nr:hypothetical protein KL86DYS1_10408 [uncultured Dysgonomonas sp.]
MGKSLLASEESEKLEISSTLTTTNPKDVSSSINLLITFKF